MSEGFASPKSLSAPEVANLRRCEKADGVVLRCTARRLERDANLESS